VIQMKKFVRKHKQKLAIIVIVIIVLAMVAGPIAAFFI